MPIEVVKAKLSDEDRIFGRGFEACDRGPEVFGTVRALGDGCVLLATHDGEPAGYLIHGFLYENRATFIQTVAVHLEHRGQGIATELMKSAYRLAYDCQDSRETKGIYSSAPLGDPVTEALHAKLQYEAVGGFHNAETGREQAMYFSSFAHHLWF